MKLSPDCREYAQKLFDDPTCGASEWNLTRTEREIAADVVRSAKKSGRGVAFHLKDMEAALSLFEEAPRDIQGRQTLSLDQEIGTGFPREGVSL